MKLKRTFTVLLLALLTAACLALLGCEDESTESEEYTIMYSDGTATHTLTVKSGEVYSISNLPQKPGYVFLGWFNSEVGGAQYITANGMSIKPFDDAKSIVLYPQFAPLTLSIVLDWGEASVTDQPLPSVSYGEVLPVLPSNLYIADRDYMHFTGWYTEPNGGGIKICDATGISTLLLNDSLCALADPQANLTLYAHFAPETYTVHFYSKNGQTPLGDVTVAHGTSISAVEIPFTDGGYHVHTWSLVRNGNPFTGEILGEWVLYALQYDITVTFDAANGLESTTVTVAEGSEAALPQASKAGFSLLGWYDAKGVKQTSPFIPTENTSLTARWEANTYTVAYHSMGGNLAAESQCVTYGSNYTLAVPTKEDCTFLGWFTAGGAQLTDATGRSLSPWGYAQSITICARWSTSSEYTVSLTRESCKKDNGYDPSEAGTVTAQKTHSFFDFLELKVKGCLQDTDGVYQIPYGSTLSIACKTLQNPASITRAAGAAYGWDNWYCHEIASDSYSGAVYGTNLNGVPIGKGAYYVKVTYTDGSYTEQNATNFLADMSLNSEKELALNVDAGRSIQKIELVFVYELYYEYYDFWEAFPKDHTNWRCSTTLTFK